jgi:type III restriction enzyme
MADSLLDFDLADEVAARVDLREPNKQALLSIAYALSRHYDAGHEPPFEGVVDVATGVGKTYVMAAAIEYFTALGFKHYAVIAPGSTILDKTVLNFSAGNPKSLLRGMKVKPELITAETFDSPMVAMQMDDHQATKLYVFTVQSLIKPTTKQGRRTHEFREALGEAFYAKLVAEPDLIVFADEHHTYYGPAFSRAIRDLEPYALIGLTATPHKKTPREQIVYRYPLAAAIADRYVKTPVIVGRRDDRDDARTKLADGARLLEFKAEAVRSFAAANGLEPVNPIMLVIAQTINEAEEYADLLQSPDFSDGRYKGRVLTIHSDQSDAALADLEKIERPNSPFRIVVSVGMLKEGWDVKNVYVIASMRASVSDILTEQTLGRGLRLPFGRYTGIEMLDTLEVVAHESYQALLKRADILKEELVDYRTLQARDAETDSAAPEVQEVRPEIFVSGAAHGGGAVRERQPGLSNAGDVEQQGGFTITSLEERTEAVSQQVEGLRAVIEARAELPDVVIPIITMTAVKGEFSLADVDPEVFRKLGERHAADPEALLLRTVVSAEADGENGRNVRLVTRTATDKVAGSTVEVPLEESVASIRRVIAASDEVPARGKELTFLDGLLNAYVTGLGGKAEEVLGAFPQRAVAAFRKELQSAQRGLHAKPQIGELLEKRPLGRTRQGRSETSRNLAGKFDKGVGYEGWKKSYFPQVWFDSDPEFRLARTADDAEDVEFWVRLTLGDLKIMYTSGENHYNPDFLVVLKDGTHLLVEVKAAKAVSNEVVQKKKDAAKRWARHASAEMGGTWEYLLVTDDDIKASRGSWAAVRAAGQ